MSRSRLRRTPDRTSLLPMNPALELVKVSVAMVLGPGSEIVIDGTVIILALLECEFAVDNALDPVTFRDREVAVFRYTAEP